MKLKPQFYKFLLKTMILILALFIAFNTIRGVTQPEQPIQIVKQHKQIADEHYIISEKMVMGKLQSKAQLVSMEQSISKTYTDVDDGFTGTRETELSMEATYKLGLETKDIEVKHIDSENGIIYLKLPKPTMISLEIPYDQVEFEKESGWLRLAMDEDEEKKFYKAAVKNVENEILNNSEIIKQAKLHNKDVVEDILSMIPTVKSVVFE
jgi:Protein of unknown function (DUF4230)